MIRPSRLGMPLLLIAGVAAAAVASDHLSTVTGIWLRAIAGTVAVASTIGGATHYRARPLRPWLVIAAALALWVSADTLWDLFDLHLTDPNSSWYVLPNVMYVVTYPALIFAVIELVRARGERPAVARVVDSFVPALVLLLLIRAFVLEGGSGGNAVEDAFNAVFPLCDALLMAAVAWLLYASQLRNISGWFLSLGMGTMLTADVMWDIHVRFDPAVLAGIVDPIYPISYAVIAAAALHPDVARVTEAPLSARGPSDDSVPRLIMLCMGLAVLPVIGYAGNRHDTLLMCTAGALVITLTIRLVRLVHDVRRGKRLAELNAETFAGLLGSAPVGIFAADADMTIFFANQATDALLGKSAVGLTTQRLVEVCVDTRDRPKIKQALATVLAGRPASAQLRIWRPDGSQRWVSWYGAPVLEHPGRFTGAFVSTIDITQQKAAELALAQQLTHDPLTGLANRRMLIERIQLAAARLGRQSRGLAVLMVDLDDFKAVNDAYGHESGDEVLRMVAMRLSHCVRADDLIARYGADQFVVVLEHLRRPDDAVLVATQILSSLSAPVSLDRSGGNVRLGASIGIATTSDATVDGDNLVLEASQAMLLAKAAGGSQYRTSTGERPLPRRSARNGAADRCSPIGHRRAAEVVEARSD